MWCKNINKKKEKRKEEEEEEKLDGGLLDIVSHFMIAPQVIVKFEIFCISDERACLSGGWSICL